MEKVLEGTTYNRSMSIIGSVVTIKHVSRLKDGDHYMTTKLDLEKMDGDDMVKHAAMNILIQIIRPRYLKQLASKGIDETKVIDPLDYPATRGGGINKREASIRTLMDVLKFSQADAELAVDHPEKTEEILKSRVKLRKNDDVETEEMDEDGEVDQTGNIEETE